MACCGPAAGLRDHDDWRYPRTLEWKRLVTGDDVPLVLAPSYDRPLLPATTVEVPNPLHTRSAQQWFNNLPDDTARAIMNTRRSMLREQQICDAVMSMHPRPPVREPRPTAEQVLTHLAVVRAQREAMAGKGRARRASAGPTARPGTAPPASGTQRMYELGAKMKLAKPGVPRVDDPMLQQQPGGLPPPLTLIIAKQQQQQQLLEEQKKKKKKPAEGEQPGQPGEGEQGPPPGKIKTFLRKLSPFKKRAGAQSPPPQPGQEGQPTEPEGPQPWYRRMWRRGRSAGGAAQAATAPPADDAAAAAAASPADGLAGPQPPQPLQPLQPLQPFQPQLGQPGQPFQPQLGQPGQPFQPQLGRPGQPFQPQLGQPGQPFQPQLGQPGQPFQPQLGRPGQPFQPQLGQPGGQPFQPQLGQPGSQPLQPMAAVRPQLPGAQLQQLPGAGGAQFPGGPQSSFSQQQQQQQQQQQPGVQLLRPQLQQQMPQFSQQAQFGGGVRPAGLSPGSQYPGSQYPGSQYPGSQYPGSQYPGAFSGQQQLGSMGGAAPMAAGAGFGVRPTGLSPAPASQYPGAAPGQMPGQQQLLQPGVGMGPAGVRPPGLGPGLQQQSFTAQQQQRPPFMAQQQQQMQTQQGYGTAPGQYGTGPAGQPPYTAGGLPPPPPAAQGLPPPPVPLPRPGSRDGYGLDNEIETADGQPPLPPPGPLPPPVGPVRRTAVPFDDNQYGLGEDIDEAEAAAQAQLPPPGPLPPGPPLVRPGRLNGINGSGRLQGPAPLPLNNAHNDPYDLPAEPLDATATAAEQRLGLPPPGPLPPPPPPPFAPTGPSRVIQRQRSLDAPAGEIEDAMEEYGLGAETEELAAPPAGLPPARPLRAAALRTSLGPEGPGGDAFSFGSREGSMVAPTPQKLRPPPPMPSRAPAQDFGLDAEEL